MSRRPSYFLIALGLSATYFVWQSCGREVLPSGYTSRLRELQARCDGSDQVHASVANASEMMKNRSRLVADKIERFNRLLRPADRQIDTLRTPAAETSRHSQTMPLAGSNHDRSFVVAAPSAVDLAHRALPPEVRSLPGWHDIEAIDNFVTRLEKFVLGWRDKVPRMYVAAVHHRLQDAERRVDEAQGVAEAERRGTVAFRDEADGASDVPGPPLDLPPWSPPSRAPAGDHADGRSADDDDGFNAARRGAVVDAIRNSWRSYWRYARNADELRPLTHRGRNWHANGTLLLTAVDAITTLHLAGLHAEVQQALDHIAGALPQLVALDADISQFEATIRLVGALTSLYELSGNRTALGMAVAFADRILPAYATPTGLPATSVNFRYGNASNPDYRLQCTALAEACSVQLELRSLTAATGNRTYVKVATRAFKHVRRQVPASRLPPTYVNTTDGTWCNSDVSVGSLGDSYYEYLLKQYLLSNRTEPAMLDLAIDAFDAIIAVLLLQHRGNASVAGPMRWYCAEATMGTDGRPSALRPRMEHLTCFLPGTLALGARELATRAETKTKADSWMVAAEALAETCVAMYVRQRTGVSPEYVEFVDGEPDFLNGAANYVLRPETMESLYYLWRITGKPIYREYGWDIFRRWNASCRVEMDAHDGLYAFSGVAHVSGEPSGAARHDDVMQSFWLAESLKYAFLLFAAENATSGVLPLDEWVLNTEAHPLRVSSDKRSETFGADFASPW